MVDHKYGIILSDIATAGNVPDPNVVPDMVRDFKRKFKIQHQYLVEDSGYKEQNVLNFVANMGYDTYLPIDKNSNAKNKEMFGPDKFVYHKERNVLICPEGKELKFKRYRKDKGIYEFKANAKECNSCPQKHNCTSSDRGRTSAISKYEGMILELINKKKTKRYKALMKKRQIYSEGSFAEAKELHGMDEACFQGAENMNIQTLMTSILQNIKKFIKYTKKSKTGAGKITKERGIQVYLTLSSRYYANYIIYVSTKWNSMNYKGVGLAA